MALPPKKRGDDLPLYVDVDVEGLANTIDGATGWFTIKRKPADPDSAALIRKTTLDGSMTKQAPKRFSWTINSADDAALPEEVYGKSLYWDFQYKGSDGRVKTTDEGSITITQDITRATG